MSAEEVDRYLSEIDEPKRATLQRLRQSILKVIPDAEQGISYGMPAFRVKGKVVAGFAAFKKITSPTHHTVVRSSGSSATTLRPTRCPRAPFGSRSTNRCRTSWSRSW